MDTSQAATEMIQHFRGMVEQFGKASTIYGRVQVEIETLDQLGAGTTVLKERLKACDDEMAEMFGNIVGAYQASVESSEESMEYLKAIAKELEGGE